MIGIQAWGSALPSLRITAKEIAVAWGSCAARGLVRKAVCCFDEDAVTLAVDAAKVCLESSNQSPRFSALFVGATSLPYDEKPSSSSILAYLSDSNSVRVSEIRGSPQAGLQALTSAYEYCVANPGKSALAIATDAPRAHPATAADHALGAGAAAFLVGAGDVKASWEGSTAVTLETFGSRFRTRGSLYREDRELRVDEDAESLSRIAVGLGVSTARLALGADPAMERRAEALLKANIVGGVWSQVGDLGAASAPLALVDALERADLNDRVLSIALGSGAMAVTVQLLKPSMATTSVAARVQLGREIGYLEYLKQTGFISRPEVGS